MMPTREAPPSKLDLNAVWDQAVRLIAANREVILVLGGVFFFLPWVVFTLLVPMPDFAGVAGPSGDNAPALMAAINGFIAEYWWAMLLLSLIVDIGAVAVMAVIGDPARPTVRAAMSRGVARLLPQFASQVLTNFSTSLVLTIALTIGALSGSPAVATTLSVFSIPVAIWLVTRFSLSGPAIAIEGKVNPLAALKRSWRLTAANSFRLLAFYALLTVAFFVIWQVAGLVTRLLAALASADIARIIEALAGSLLLAAFFLVGYAVLASVHRQLARAERVAAPDPA